MEQTREFNLYKDIAERTDGDVYIGVVGPVRTGKSTFISRFMEQIVLPRITESPKKTRIADELPQSGSGRTIMTTQPKFVPGEAVTVTLSENTPVRLRLVDSVGYLVRGALGVSDEDGTRMVHTPWFEHDIPFDQAAEIGTRKVIAEQPLAWSSPRTEPLPIFRAVPMWMLKRGSSESSRRLESPS